MIWDFLIVNKEEKNSVNGIIWEQEKNQWQTKKYDKWQMTTKSITKICNERYLIYHAALWYYGMKHLANHVLPAVFFSGS